MYRTVLSVLIVCLALTACGGKATPDPAVVAQAVAATLTAQASAVTLIAEAPTVIATPTDAPSSTAMLTATLIPLPTVTPTPTDTPLPPMPTATPAATPSLTPEVPIAVVQSQALNVRAGPGTEHPVVASAERGETLTVVGRNEDASWLEVMLPEGQRGWAAGWLVGVSILSGDVPLSSMIPTPPARLVAQPAPAQGRIVFVSDVHGQNDIYTMNLDGSDWKRLTERGGYGPKWSPDGSRIAFYSRMDGNNEVYTMAADGGNLVRLTNDPASDWAPDWSPDGTRIVFVAHRDGVSNLYVMNSDGANQRRLTDTPGVGEWHPAWSPDGARVLFTRVIDGNGDGRISVWADTEFICIVNADSTGERCLTSSSDSHHTSGTAWHPDGTSFAFGSLRRKEYWRIWTMNIDGTDARELLRSANSDLPAAYSSDGSKLLFQSWRHGHWEIYVANADGSNHVLLTHNEDNNFDADWTE